MTILLKCKCSKQEISSENWIHVVYPKISSYYRHPYDENVLPIRIKIIRCLFWSGLHRLYRVLTEMLSYLRCGSTGDHMWSGPWAITDWKILFLSTSPLPLCDVPSLYPMSKRNIRWRWRHEIIDLIFLASFKKTLRLKYMYWLLT